MSRFDTLVDRRNSSSRKWDGHAVFGYEQDVLPLWVADMDVQTVDAVTQAVTQRASSGVYGYTMMEEGTTLAIKNWMKRRFDWDIEEKWVVHTPGVVFALHLAVQLFTKPQDAIMISRPVYPPFAKSILINDRTLVDCPLVLEGHSYSFDFALFERLIVERNVTMFIFCNPHNPVGKVFTDEEIRQIGNICLRHDIIVISDEIHQDFVYPQYQHVPFTKVDPAFQKNTIICTAPSKTFNLAGMQFSNIIIASEDLRTAFMDGMERLGIHLTGTFSSMSCKLAYDNGDDFVNDIVSHIQGNGAYVRSFLQKHLPMIHLIEPQALYLLWLDMRELGMSDEELDRFLIHDAKVWLNQGHTFGQGGFVRMNVACHRSTLEEAMARIERAVKQRLR